MSAGRVAIVGVGYTPFRPITPDVSFREMVYEAAAKAYEDAGIEPQKDLDACVTCQDDFEHGRSIWNEQTPDSLGAVLKPVGTIPGDGIYGLIDAYMQIRSGLRNVVVVETHSKASNMITRNYLLAHAPDPIYNKPLSQHPYYIAGMEMNRFLYETGNTKEQCAMVAVKNRRNALSNPVAAYGQKSAVEDVLGSEMISYPLTELDTSSHADGGIVMVLASEDRARSLAGKPVWIKGVGWCSETPWLESRNWGEAVYAKLAADMAYRIAKINEPREDIDFAEVDDTFSYKELQHLEALGLCQRGMAGRMTSDGVTQRQGELPVNVSGGSLGVGHLVEATGLQKVLEVVLQLRGEAGKRQLDNARVGLAQSWRGIPYASGAVAILSRE
ncbi:MAG: acetyl-CoA acetyltransferase [Chloroflexi bacterium]|nr:acetyl-CoA acetyltransferase [Chloroflexota bacterium]